ncbi:MAG: hypothetical protein JOZ85_15805, partial [Betaproteobacteria bacterium]|nr:hypothetical protein [Betaproteobacteria bacterium]
MKRRAFLQTITFVPAAAAAGVPLRSIDNPAAPGTVYFTQDETAFIDAVVS